MIPFATFIVEAHHPLPITDVDRAVLIAMLCGWNRLWNTPDHQFHDGAVGVDVLEAGDQLRWHVVNYDNISVSMQARCSH